jgi:hypothetical protein
MDDNKIGAEIRKYILHTQLRDTSTTDKVQEYWEIVRAAGYRVVTGGQVSGEYWEVRDAETDEFLKEGSGYDNFKLELEEHWIFSDALHDLVLELGGESDIDPKQGISLPTGLLDVLEDWASDNPDEVRALLSE